MGPGYSSVGKYLPRKHEALVYHWLLINYVGGTSPVLRKGRLEEQNFKVILCFIAIWRPS